MYRIHSVRTGSWLVMNSMNGDLYGTPGVWDYINKLDQNNHWFIDDAGNRDGTLYIKETSSGNNLYVTACRGCHHHSFHTALRSPPSSPPSSSSYKASLNASQSLPSSAPAVNSAAVTAHRMTAFDGPLLHVPLLATCALSGRSPAPSMHHCALC
jgi:hypothetical protein